MNFDTRSCMCPILTEKLTIAEKEIENYEINILKVMKSNSVEVQAHSVTRKKLTIAVEALNDIKILRRKDDNDNEHEGVEAYISNKALRKIGEMK